MDDEKKRAAFNYINNYQKEKYDRITIIRPKGEKEKLSGIAKEKGYKNLTEFINAAVNSEINTVGAVVNNIMVLSFLQSMFEFESDGLNYNVTFLNKELLNGSIPNPIIYELVYTDEGQFEDINRITL